MGVKIGFRFVPLPVDIWDQSIDLSLAEFRLLGYLIRRQVRFGKTPSPLSYDELMSGPWRQGRRLDAGCGLSRNSLKQALELLKDRGWIKITDLSDNPRLPRLVVEVLISDDEASDFDNQSSNSDDAPSSQPDSRSSQSDDEMPVSSSTSDDLYKKVEEKKEKKSIGDWDTVDTRILCESLGIHDIRQEEAMNRLYKTFTKTSKFSPEKAREYMKARWDLYKAKMPKLEWTFGGAYKFFMSGTWDNPDGWPKKKNIDGDTSAMKFAN